MLNILWSDSVTIYFGFRALHTSVWKTISLPSTTLSSPNHVNVGWVVHWQSSVGVRYFNPIKKYKYQPIPHNFYGIIKTGFALARLYGERGL